MNNQTTFALEFWQLLSLLLGFFGFLFAAGRILLAQIEQRLNDRFGAINAALVALHEEAKGWQQLEREFLQFKAEIPMVYVQRADFVRNQTVIEAKLDSLAVRIDNAQMRGNS